MLANTTYLEIEKEYKNQITGCLHRLLTTFKMDNYWKRVPNRFGGMRDSAFFRRDIRDSSSKLGWEAGIKITSRSGISGFHGVGIRYSQRKQSGIRDFDPSFRVLLKPWSLHRHFFLALCFQVKHDRVSERGLPPTEIDQRKNC